MFKMVDSTNRSERIKPSLGYIGIYEMHVETFLDMNVICSPICDVASYQNSIPKVNASIGKVIIDCEVWVCPIFSQTHVVSAKAMDQNWGLF